MCNINTLILLKIISTEYFLYLFLMKRPEEGHTNARNVGKITKGFLI